MTSRPGHKAFLKLSFYEVLGVSEDVDSEELKVTFWFSTPTLRLSNQLSPDRERTVRRL